MKWMMPLILGILVLSFMPMVQAADSPHVIITEIFPDPPGSDLGGEFVEIMNEGDESINMQNWTISDQDGSVDFTFPNISLKPGQRAVVFVRSGNASMINGAYHFYMNKGSSMLNNDGDDVLLSDSHGNPMDYVAYGSGKYVDPAPEGMKWDENISAQSGLSLQRSGDTGKWFWGMPTPGERNIVESSDFNISIASFYPYARYGDEFVEIRNEGNEDADISGYCINDGEGFLYIPVGTVLGANSSMYITQNYSGFLGEMGFAPNLTYRDCYTPSHYPQLANSGDELYIYNPSGAMIFSVEYGDGRELPAPHAGDVYRYTGSWNIQRIGRSSFPLFNLSYKGNITVFSSPNSSLKSVIREIDAARNEIVINTYEFSSQEVAQALLRAMARGVKVRVLVEGGPVGGIPDMEISVLSALSSAGADVRFMENNNRYSFDHAKYMIIDNQSLLIESENFNRDAMPYSGEGNRGWGVIIRNRSAALYMRDVFQRDYNLNFSDISVFNPNSTGIDWEPHAPDLSEGKSISGEFNISIIPGPEHGLDEIVGAIESAEKSVYIEQFYITYEWGDGKNPLIDAIINASLRGCDVRVILDGSYYNTDSDFDNDELAEYLNDFGEEHGLNLSAKVIDLERHGLVKVHNKGMIIDGKLTLISSFNWGMNSFTNNRELAVMVENKDVASYFTSLFMEDWKSDFNPPVAVIHGPKTLRVNTSYEFISDSTDDTAISSCLWYLDGNELSTNSTIALNFTATGHHILELSVWDIDGNENSTEMEILVVPEDMPVNEVDNHDFRQEQSNPVDNEITDASPSNSSTSNSNSTNEPSKDVERNEVHDSGENSMVDYLLIVPALLIIMSAMKISWKKEN